MFLDLILGIMGVLLTLLVIVTFIVALAGAFCLLLWGPGILVATVIGGTKAFMAWIEKDSRKDEGSPKESNPT